MSDLTAFGEKVRADAERYLKRNGAEDLLPMLGLAESPPPRRKPRIMGIDRSLPGCLCSKGGKRYRLCKHHGDPEALKGLSQ